MQPRIETTGEKKLVGIRVKMSLSNNKTKELWQSFMPRRKEVTNNIGSELFSIEVYDSTYFINFNYNTEFDKWAAVEVSDIEFIPIQMEMITIPSGLYAVFIHRGPASSGSKTFQYIFQTWLPNSEYFIDN